MPGKRLKDPSLNRVQFTEAVEKGAEILTDWEGLAEARPLLLARTGNSYFQGSYDNIIYTDQVEIDHAYVRLSTDGGNAIAGANGNSQPGGGTWIVFKMSDCNGNGGDIHPPVTIGSPEGGLIISGDDTQVLTLPCATVYKPGALCPTDKIRINNIKWYDILNEGGGYEVYTDSTVVDDQITFNLKTIVEGTNTTISYVGDTIVINSNTSSTTGQANTGHNDGTDGVGVFDRMNGDILEFRHVAVDALDTKGILTIALDVADHDIDFFIDETKIDHDLTLNYAINEHIDHSAVEIVTEEGIKGGGDITTTRTLSMDIFRLDPIVYDEDDLMVVYDEDTSTHHKITLSSLPFGEDNVPVYVHAGLGLRQTDGPELADSTTLYLDIYSLPPIAYDPADYVAVYDTSNATHARTLISAISGTVTQIDEGDGIDLIPNSITTTGVVSIEVPEPVTESSTDIKGTAGVSGHTHSLSIANLTYITDVNNTPVSGEYLKWDGSDWVTDDPSIGATTPGLPLNSIQFNDNSTFGGSAGLIYDETLDSIYLDSITVGNSGLYFGSNQLSPGILSDSTDLLIVNNYGYTLINTIQVGFGAITPEVDVFFQIKDTNGTPFTNTINVLNASNDDIFTVASSGAIYAPELSSAIEDNILYFDTITGLITFGSPGSSSGGIQTLEADNLSGLMVNGGSTSSASIIELDQNDNKLPENVPAITDWIGFYDESKGIQSKSRMGFLPGWDIWVNSIFQEEISPGDKVDFKAEGNIELEYSINTNQLIIRGISEEGISSVYTEKSIQGDGTELSKIQLVGDEAVPNILNYYGTNSAGIKGYHTI